MTLQKGFLHRKPPLSETPLTRKFIGPFMGALFAISLYALFYLFRDMVRAIPHVAPEYFWALSSDELNFYNFFFAAVASLLGQSVCFNIWLNRSGNIFSEPRLPRIRVLHDQRFMIWYFLAWFSKVAAMYGILFGFTFWGGHFVFSFYPDYRFLFYLILIVLFLQSWTSFRLLFPKQSLKRMLVSALILGCFSFGLSRINFIDQKAFQYNRQRGSIYFQYDFKLPQSSYFDYAGPRYFSLDLHLVVDSASKTSPPYTLLLDRKEIIVSDLYKLLMAEINDFNDFDRPLIFIRFYIDKRVSIEFVEEVKASIARAGISKIFYMVVPENHEYDVRFYNGLGVPSKLLVYDYFEKGSLEQDIPPTPDFIVEPPMTVSPKKVRIDSDNHDQLVTTLTQLIREQPNKIIRYNYNPQDPFWKYLNMLVSTYEATDIVREEVFSTKVDSSMTDSEKEELRDEISQTYRKGFLAVPKK